MTGVGRVVAYNWPTYAVVLAGCLLTAALPWPWPLLAAPVLAGVAISLAATWWAYDLSGLYDWRWCLALLPTPHRYAVVSTGIDEIGPALRRVLPGAAPTLLDLYDPGVTTEGSIRRARRWTPLSRDAIPSTVDALPVPAQALDAVFLAFAAHELRIPAQREALFGEVARILRPGGHLALVEHCRGPATIAAYGPGAWHFYPRAEWLRVAAGAGLTLTAETTKTPLVHALVFRR